MRHAIYSLILVLCGFSSHLFADGGYWRVTGRVDNVDTDAFGTTRCEMENLRLRLRSRWANGEGCVVGFTGECPWGLSWGETTTDSSGRFAKTSHRFVDRTRKRDILIEFRKLGSWHQLAIISDVSSQTPHQGSGDTWTFLFGTFETTAFDCPIELVSADGDSPPAPVVEVTPLDPGGNQNRGSGGRNNSPPGQPQIEEVPCGVGPGGNPGIDLSFAASEVRHRNNQPNAPPERVTWEVTIRNSGPATYSGTGDCRTKVRAVFAVPELDAERSYELTLVGAIPAGSSRTFTSNSGNLGELSEEESVSYNVMFTIDPENRILESNEGNNQQPGCYTPATEVYIESPCPSQPQPNRRSRGRKGSTPRKLPPNQKR